jgi:hypothetical protein
MPDRKAHRLEAYYRPFSGRIDWNVLCHNVETYDLAAWYISQYGRYEPPRDTKDICKTCLKMLKKELTG